jgi:hypothetical protein
MTLELRRMLDTKHQVHSMEVQSSITGNRRRVAAYAAIGAAHGTSNPRAALLKCVRRVSDARMQRSTPSALAASGGKTKIQALKDTAQ